ncbi:holotricin-1 [Asbolus verrucosus]|uniref:Holotricin-1 n=1 Tax=Asbolus verrucosus TaxID=1661398 RepID=A0A482W2Q5_ASBVE|nr:holotricin-1 [Asbolus verrucosus]
MKFAIILAISAAMCIFRVSAFPLDEALEDEPLAEHVRHKRFTCDVLSAEFGTIKLNHAACATHCLFRLRGGGYCNARRVCICR